MVTEMGQRCQRSIRRGSGSNRREFVNRKLARALARLGDEKLTTRFVRIDDLPIFNQDQENPLPASVARFKAEIGEPDALLIVTPEHNRSIPAVLKNAIDWGARPYGQNSWAGKLAAITGTSPGAIGTAVAQQHLRQVLGNLGAQVMGGEAYVSFSRASSTKTTRWRMRAPASSCRRLSISSRRSLPALPVTHQRA